MTEADPIVCWMPCCWCEGTGVLIQHSWFRRIEAACGQCGGSGKTHVRRQSDLDREAEWRRKRKLAAAAEMEQEEYVRERGRIRARAEFGYQAKGEAAMGTPPMGKSSVQPPE